MPSMESDAGSEQQVPERENPSRSRCPNDTLAPASPRDEILAEFALAISSLNKFELQKDGTLSPSRRYREANGNHQSPKDCRSLENLFANSTVGDGDQICCTIPSMKLDELSLESSSQELPICKNSLEHAAAESLSTPLHIAKEDLSTLPHTIVRNISHSFDILVGARIRSYLTALLLQSKDSTDRFATFLSDFVASGSDVIAPSAILTAFQLVPPPADHCSLSLQTPLLLETILELDILGESIKICFSGGGTIAATFDNSDRLKHVTIAFRTKDFLTNMMDEIRFAVRKAIGTISELVMMGTIQEIADINSENSTSEEGKAASPPNGLATERSPITSREPSPDPKKRKEEEHEESTKTTPTMFITTPSIEKITSSSEPYPLLDLEAEAQSCSAQSHPVQYPSKSPDCTDDGASSNDKDKEPECEPNDNGQRLSLLTMAAHSLD